MPGQEHGPNDRKPIQPLLYCRRQYLQEFQGRGFTVSDAFQHSQDVLFRGSDIPVLSQEFEVFQPRRSNL